MEAWPVTRAEYDNRLLHLQALATRRNLVEITSS
jgi:hypothetical protein